MSDLASEVQRQREALAEALTAPVAQVMARIPAEDLYGQESARTVAVREIGAWLASVDPVLVEYWGTHAGTSLAALDAITAIAGHISAMRAERKRLRNEWVVDMVTFFGANVDRERLEAGVMPRGDVEAIVWGAVKAPQGASNGNKCPRCGGPHTSPVAVKKPVSVEVWERAKEIVAAFDWAMLEGLGLAATRDIMTIAYDCEDCAFRNRRELVVTLSHPENGWVGSPRYYPLD